MQAFILGNRTNIYFGSEHTADMVREMEKYGNKFLLVFGKESVLKNGVYERIMSAMKEKGMVWEELWGVESNPQVEKVRLGIDVVRKNGIDAVLGVGGGSVLDTVKAIAVGVGYGGDVWDFFVGKAKPHGEVPYGCVMTTIGSGSEVSRGCVLSNGKEKRSLSHDYFRPYFSLIDTKAMEYLDTAQILPGCMDILVHVTERYFSDTPYIEYTDALCLVTVEHIVRNMRRIRNHVEWEETVKELAYLSMIAQVGYLASGRQTDGACHQMEHVLSGMYGVSHTAGIGMIFFAWAKKVSGCKKEKFRKLFEAMFDKKADAREGMEMLAAFYDEMGLPRTCRIEGEPEKAALELAGICIGGCGGKVGHFMELDREDVMGIYRDCLEEDGGED